uniref:Uncharacterized protein n=1 Tax=Romanomermis culicivorax TaxID=13658 RepID=A0A915LAK7_ROMCU
MRTAYIYQFPIKQSVLHTLLLLSCQPGNRIKEVQFHKSIDNWQLHQMDQLRSATPCISN